jgi:hypothetical protein
MKTENETFDAFSQLAGALKIQLESSSQLRLISGANIRCAFQEGAKCSRLCPSNLTVTSVSLTLSLLLQEAELSDENYSVENIQSAFDRYMDQIKKNSTVSESKCKPVSPVTS